LILYDTVGDTWQEGGLYLNIGIIGIGGVGGYFGGKLTQLLNRDDTPRIYFIARGEHLNEIRKNGLVLDSDEGRMVCTPTLSTDRISDLPPLDLCLICVKSYDLDRVTGQLRSKIAENTMMLPLLNGVDIYERIRANIPSGILFPACVYVATHIEKPGMVKQRGASCTIHFGPDPQNKSAPPKLFELFKRAAVKYDWTESPYIEIWSKFIFIASFGLVTANFDKTLGEIVRSGELSRHVRSIMAEVNALALKKGIALPSTIIEESFEKGRKIPFEAKTSFQRDYERKDKPDERDLFCGTIVRLGKELGVKTETTEMIYRSIQERKKAPD
jgi:2-dehydropantoate 2-reductase